MFCKSNIDISIISNIKIYANAPENKSPENNKNCIICLYLEIIL